MVQVEDSQPKKAKAGAVPVIVVSSTKAQNSFDNRQSTKESSRNSTVIVENDNHRSNVPQQKVESFMTDLINSESYDTLKRSPA